jgi:hypothetical protein
VIWIAQKQRRTGGIPRRRAALVITYENRNYSSMMTVVPFLFLLGLVQVELARALRLSPARVLCVREVGVGPGIAHRRFAGWTISPLVRRLVAERVAGLGLELFGEIVFGAAAVAAMGIAALVQWMVEFVAAVLPEIGHGHPPGMSGGGADAVPDGSRPCAKTQMPRRIRRGIRVLLFQHVDERAYQR